MRSRFRSFALLLVVCLMGSGPVLTRQQTPPAKPESQQPPTFRTEANFVRVDVLATRGGKAVRDLKAEDFELLEDGVRQTISTFEHVEVGSTVPQELRTEPNSIRDSRDALKNPRARVFVLFLDAGHVTTHGSWSIREPLIRMIDRVLASEDLIGIMTPTMSPDQIVFARKTQVLAAGLRDKWPWGERFTLETDNREQLYVACYGAAFHSAVTRELIDRKRERNTLEALEALVNWLRFEREERKAIVTISEGWVLYRPSAKLADAAAGSSPAGPVPIGADPTTGKLRVGNNTTLNPALRHDCVADAITLANYDNDRFFRDLIARANRANASFYAIDPRGLAAFDSPIGPAPPPPPHIDQQILRSRLDALQVIASETDGLAVLNSNDLDKGLRRISDDLSSYYLLGYYSTNAKLDGRFRRVQVKVKQPGVDIRARRGYRAATQEEVTAARKAASAPVPAAVASAHTAVGALRVRPGAELSVHGIALKGSDSTTVWIAGEIAQPLATPGSAIITVRALGATNSTEVQLAPKQRGFVTFVPLKAAAPDQVEVMVRVTGPDAAALSDAVIVNAGEGLPHPLMFRRGPATGNRVEAAGQAVFSRTERARFEVPLMAADVKLESARILDRNGTATEIPVAITERSDAGQRWGVADLILAALAAGDYLIELSSSTGGTQHKVLTAFRVTR